MAPKYWQYCLSCDEAMMKGTLFKCKGCKAAIYCSDKCLNFDMQCGFHEKECRKLQMPEMFLHRVALRGQCQSACKLVFSKTPSKAAEEILRLADRTNTSFCDVVMKWAEFRRDKKLYDLAIMVKKKYGGQHARPEYKVDRLLSWEEVCKGMKKEKENNYRPLAKNPSTQISISLHDERGDRDRKPTSVRDRRRDDDSRRTSDTKPSTKSGGRNLDGRNRRSVASPRGGRTRMRPRSREDSPRGRSSPKNRSLSPKFGGARSEGFRTNSAKKNLRCKLRDSVSDGKKKNRYANTSPSTSRARF